MTKEGGILLVRKSTNLENKLKRLAARNSTLEKMNKSLKAENKQLIKIYKLAEGLLACNDLHQFHDIACKASVDIFKFDQAGLLEIDQESNVCKFLSNFNLDIENLNITEEFYEYIGKFQKSPNEIFIQESFNSPLKETDTEYFFCMPVKISKTKIKIVVGTIIKENADFGDYSLRFIQTLFKNFCALIAHCLENIEIVEKKISETSVINNFLTNLSHEIRSPLNAIIGTTILAKKKNSVEEIMPCIDQIEIFSKHLLTLSNEFLSLTKINKGKIIVYNKLFELDDCLKTIISTITEEAKNKDIELILHNLTSVNTIYGDSLKLSQVLINLLSNAVKFTNEGGKIHFIIEEPDIRSNKVLLKFSVIDNGIGISQKAIKRLFEPFEQENSDTYEKYGGTGLGLYISKRIIEIMGSNLNVKSTIGKGTFFWFSLWFQTAATTASPPVSVPQLPDLTDCRLLVVDDLKVNREIVHAFLEDTSVKIDFSPNGTKAIELFKNAPEFYYNIILMDLNMDGITGLEATKIIRALNRKDAKKVIILAMTANAFEDDIKNIYNAEMDGYILKPVAPDILISTITKFLKYSDSTLK